MDPVNAAALASAGTSIVVQAAQTVGGKLLESATDAAADEATGLAHRLLNRLLRRTPTDTANPATQDQLSQAIEGLVLDPTDPDAAAEVRAVIKRLLTQDQTLLTDVAALIPVTASGNRSVAIGGNNSGTIITGNNNQTLP